MAGQQQSGAPVVPRYTKDDKFLRGKNGRLFLDNDQNDVVRQHTGERLFSHADLRHWRLLLESRTAILEKHGIAYLHFVPPNAHSVYGEDLPDDVRPHEKRPIFQLLDELESRQSFARLIYPLDELLAAKPRLLYPRTDPHWTAIGAFIAYQRLADEISRVAPMHRVVEEDVIFIETTLVGELGFKVEPQMEAPGASVAVTRPTAYLVADNCVNNTGSMLITECPEAPPGTCVVLGDSYSDALSLYLAASFRKYVYAYTPRMDYDLVREHRPDVVVTVLNERFMITPPDDLRGQSVRELEHEKKAHGLLREETPVFQRRPAAQP